MKKKGVMPKVWQFAANDKKKEDNVFKATVSYGQGMTSTFMQVLKAYSIFNNEGISVTPKILSYIDVEGDKYREDSLKMIELLQKKLLMRLKDFL